jgi:hypothetical protein
MSLNLTVFFEDPFWVGTFSRREGPSVCYCRVVFGAEPSDIEVYRFVLQNWLNLKFSSALPDTAPQPIIKNPKRRQREVSRQLQQSAGQKKSLELIKQTIYSEQRQSRQESHQEQMLAHREYIYQVRQARHKARHRGH